jgi:hypothetical protein
MKYRIKITTYANGRKEYKAYVKNWLWTGLSYEGRTDFITSRLDTREQALKAIDLHYEGNNRVQSIEFQYINK